jgi:hypothetical protein
MGDKKGNISQAVEGLMQKINRQQYQVPEKHGQA